jgi:hypothetical protein
MIRKSKFSRISTKGAMVYFKAEFQHFFRDTDENYEVSKSEAVASELIPGSPEYDTGMLYIQMRRSVEYG